MNDVIEEAIEFLAEQSTAANVKSDDALKFTQAALNLAHVLSVQAHTKLVK